MNFWKLQIRNGDTGKNFVDESLKDKRITTHEDYAQGFLSNVQMGDVVLIHKGTYPVCLVKIINKIEDDSEIVGTSFGHDYKVEILSWYEEIKINKKVFENDFTVGHNGTFSLLKNDSPTLTQIKRWYYHIIKKNEMKEILNILKYKKQIILQGPPGTGKTRLAEELVNSFIDTKSTVSISYYTIDYIEKFEPTEKSQEIEKNAERLLREFQESFPISRLENIGIDEYALGNGSKESFCYLIEKRLSSTCRFSPGPAGTTVYGISFDKDNGEIRVDLNESPETYMVKLRKMLVDLVSQKDYSNAREMKFRYSFILKILHSYFPNDYFPVLSQEHLKVFTKIFKVNATGLNDVQINMAINEKFNELKNTLNSSISSIVLMRHLYEKFDLKNEDFNEIVIPEKVSKGGEYKIVQFHPSYTYEDFVRGIIAEPWGEGVVYKAKDKILADLANKALNNKTEKYVLIIDEINRANLSTVLGELIYALEYRYKFDDSDRGHKKATVESMYGIMDDLKQKEDYTLRLPENLYIIGTMNTADRSVGHIDYAIRRRFAFVDVLPQKLEDNKEIFFNSTGFREVAKLFIDIENDNDTDFKNAKDSEFLSNDFSAKDVALGHSYFIADRKDVSEDEKENFFKMRMHYEVLPILNEYMKDGVFNEKAITKIKEIEQYFA